MLSTNAALELHAKLFKKGSESLRRLKPLTCRARTKKKSSDLSHFIFHLGRGCPASFACRHQLSCSQNLQYLSLAFFFAFARTNDNNDADSSVQDGSGQELREDETTMTTGFCFALRHKASSATPLSIKFWRWKTIQHIPLLSTSQQNTHFKKWTRF